MATRSKVLLAILNTIYFINPVKSKTATTGMWSDAGGKPPRTALTNAAMTLQLSVGLERSQSNARFGCVTNMQ
jgi:hypothetical protein